VHCSSSEEEELLSLLHQAALACIMDVNMFLTAPEGSRHVDTMSQRSQVDLCTETPAGIASISQRLNQSCRETLCPPPAAAH